MTRELRDQSAHFGAGFLAICIANLMGADIGPAAGAFLKGFAGLVREITEEGEVSWSTFKRALGSRLDLTFWALGGLSAGTLGSL